jgi:hypothetical protein
MERNSSSYIVTSGADPLRFGFAGTIGQFLCPSAVSENHPNDDDKNSSAQ